MSEENDFGSVIDRLSKLIGVLVLVVLLFLLNAFVIIKLWSWFVLILFPECPRLTYPIAIGLSLLVSLLTRHSYSKNDGLKDKWLDAFAYPLVSLLAGWIAHCFV